MKLSCIHAASAAVLLFLCAGLSAQQTPNPNAMSEKEEASLRQALGEAGNSSVDFERALEDHLAKYPNSPRRADLERALLKTAMDLKDNARIIRYGETVLKQQPNDSNILEGLTVALIQTGGTANAESALKHAEHLQSLVDKPDPNANSLSPQLRISREDQRLRALASAYLLEARAHGLLGHTDQAIALSEKSYQIFPSVEAAREASRWLESAGKTQEAIEYRADAFTIVGLASANPDAAGDRKAMGDLYQKLNGSNKGLGDLVLQAYDRTFAQLAAHREELRKADPNAQLKDPMQFTVSDVNGGKLQLADLKGKVIVMDFWATWCGPCRGQHPLYDQVREHFKNRDDVVFLAIDSDEDHTVVKPFLEQNKWTEKVYFEDGLARLLQVSNIPTTLIFDKKGELFSRMAGFIPERFVEMLTDRINEALGERSVLQATKQ